jgi:hypothetical protein
VAGRYGWRWITRGILLLLGCGLIAFCQNWLFGVYVAEPDHSAPHPTSPSEVYQHPINSNSDGQTITERAHQISKNMILNEL